MQVPQHVGATWVLQTLVTLPTTSVPPTPSYNFGTPYPFLQLRYPLPLPKS